MVELVAPGDVVADSAGTAATIVAAWLAATVTLACLGRLPGRLGLVARAVSGRVTPAAVRRTVEGVLTALLALTGACAPAAHAQEPAPPVGPFERLEPPRPSPAVPLDVVVVAPGDTLWGLAARRLGPAAAPRAIAQEWPRWHRANRGVIGPDPDVIRPGQRLRPPASA